MVAAIDNAGQPSFYTGTMQFFERDPLPGRWLFLLLINDSIAGAATAQPFQATIAFNQVEVRTRGVPQNARMRLPAGRPVRVSIHVTNTGLATNQFFVDARLATMGVVPLPAPDNYSVTLPITAGQSLPPFQVPPELSELDLPPPRLRPSILTSPP